MKFNKSKISFLKEARRVIMRLINLPFILKDIFKYKKLEKTTLSKRFHLSILNSWPFIFDKTISTPFDRHYVYHTAWAARVVKKINPQVHVDISSSLFFSSICSAFVPVKFYDYRPAVLKLDNFSSEAANLLCLPFPDNSQHSISCMHTIEHVGLGRYGDPIDPDGDIKAISELKRVTTHGGNIIFVVPIGKSTLLFNAMRIYSYEQVISYFQDMKLVEYALIHEYEEDGDISYNVPKEVSDKENYGCGCFWFKKV